MSSLPLHTTRGVLGNLYTNKYMRQHIKIVRSHNKKTIELRIMPDTTIILRIPHFLTDTAIADFLQKNSKWIEKKQHEIKGKTHHLSNKKFIDGEEFLLLGKKYPLILTTATQHPLIFRNSFYLNRYNMKNARTYFVNFYKKSALEVLTKRTLLYASEIKLQYKSISLSDANSRWGSCSYDNKLSFNWRLIMAPIPVIDYVVIHELVHIAEKNHTKKFWRKVTAFYPHYVDYKNWLSEYGYTLQF